MKNHLSNKTQAGTKPAAKPSLDLAAYNRSDKEKRPEEVEVEKLFLDPKNPRLAETSHTGRRLQFCG